jgi:HlyD family secretion protein
MKRILKYILLALVGIGIIATFVYLWKKSQPEEVRYALVAPSVKTIEKRTVATGKVAPRDEVLIKPQISGIITELYKQAGDRVSEGEAIAKVKVIPDMSQLNSAQSNVRQAQITLEQAESDFRRVSKLYDEKVVSREDYEKAQTTYNSALESMQNATANLEIVTEGISKRSGKFNNTIVRSTITGMVLDVPVKVGNSVILSNTFNDGTTIATVANMADMLFVGKIDETEVGRVSIGMPIELTLGAMQNRTLEAVLEYIAPKATEESGSVLFEIKAAAKVPEDIFVRSGYSANASIILQQSKDVVSLPESCIEFAGDSTFVYVASGPEDNPTFTRRAVVTGLSDGLNIEVKEGLTTEEKVRGNRIVNN